MGASVDATLGVDTCQEFMRGSLSRDDGAPSTGFPAHAQSRASIWFIAWVMPSSMPISRTCSSCSSDR
ncbi:hypothetical protein TSHO111613_21530 [Tsukamurella hominis]